MQTYLRGRDMITTQEWTKEEIDTIMDVAFDLKRKRALGIPHAYLRDKVLAMLFFLNIGSFLGLWTIGMIILGESSPKAMLKMMLSPGLFSIVLALVIALTWLNRFIP